jgi:hypothetical protein
VFHKKKEFIPEPTHPSIERARKLATLLDSAITIPVINKKIGLDPILGLLPVSGDVIAALMGLYIVYVSWEIGLPTHITTRMLTYLLIDIVLGLLPVVGDMADFFFKSNKLNIKLLEEGYKQHGARDRVSSTSYKTTIDVKAETV